MSDEFAELISEMNRDRQEELASLRQQLAAANAEIERLRKIEAAARSVDQWEWDATYFRDELADIAEMVLVHQSLAKSLASDGGKCEKCHGAGWLYPHEAGDHVTDQRYTCDVCRGSGFASDGGKDGGVK